MVGEVDVLNQASGFATSMTDTMSGLVYPAVFVVLFIVIMLAVVWYASHRHIVAIRILGREKSKPFIDRAREVEVDGVTHWKLLKRKHIIPVPPAEVLTNITGSGKPKFYAEFSWSEETAYVPLIYDLNTENFNDKVKLLQNGRILQDSFQPLTPQQRSLFMGQMRKAAERKKKGIWEQINALATPVMLVLVIFGGLMFWEDIAKPAKEMAEINVGMQAQTGRIVSDLAEVTNQLARVTSALTGEDIPINQRVGDDSP